LDLGSCGSPEIQFANGLDGRKEPSFQGLSISRPYSPYFILIIFIAINQGDFNHGSALNIGVITSENKRLCVSFIQSEIIVPRLHLRTTSEQV